MNPPVRFRRAENGNYAIWDTGTIPGARGVPYAQTGEIARCIIGESVLWALHRERFPSVWNLPTVTEAKRTYLLQRNPPIDPDSYLPKSPPPIPDIDVHLTLAQYEKLDPWRAEVFRALNGWNSAAAITVMLTPVRTDYQSRTCTLRLPEPIAQHLTRWLYRVT